MKPQKGISEVDVHEAAFAAIRDGVPPSGEEILRRIGRGSKSTVFKYLGTLWPRLADALDATRPDIPDLPPGVADAAMTLWRGALGHARSIAEVEVAGARETAQILHDEGVSALATAESMRDEAEVSVARLEQTVATLTRERDAAAEARAVLEVSLKQAADSAAELERERERGQRTVQGLEQARETAAAEHRAELERLAASHEAEIDRLSLSLDRARADSAALARQDAERLRLLEQRLTAANDAHLAAARSAAALQVRVANLEQDMAEAMAQQSQVRDALEESERARRAAEDLATAARDREDRVREAADLRIREAEERADSAQRLLGEAQATIRELAARRTSKPRRERPS
jgi:chromosome segregation ATPase